MKMLKSVLIQNKQSLQKLTNSLIPILSSLTHRPSASKNSHFQSCSLSASQSFHLLRHVSFLYSQTSFSLTLAPWHNRISMTSKSPDSAGKCKGVLKSTKIKKYISTLSLLNLKYPLSQNTSHYPYSIS